MRGRDAQRDFVRTAVDVDVAAHGVDIAQAVESWFAAREPEDARQNPVPFRESGGQFR